MPTPPTAAPDAPRIADGGNAEVYAWEGGRVLKLFRDGFSPRVADAEMRHARAAHALGIPTPRVDGLIEHRGRTGILFERCDGPTLYQLAESETLPVSRAAQILFELQRAVHQCRIESLGRLSDRWIAKIRHARGVTEEVRRRALDAVGALPRGEAACHGDFHPSNVLMSPRGPVIIDWLDAGAGDPAADVARTLLLVETARPGRVPRHIRTGFLTAYEACWRAAWGPRFERVRLWRLPAIVARLAEVREDGEHAALARLARDEAAA